MILHDLGWEEMDEEDELEEELDHVMSCLREVRRNIENERDDDILDSLEEKHEELTLWRNNLRRKIEARQESRCGL